MKEELISFETAKLAKEKKMDIPVNTQSLLQRWLRENKKIDVEVTRSIDFATELFLDTFDVAVNNTKFNFNSKNHVFIQYLNSYEEALEKGLQEALKMIK